MSIKLTDWTNLVEIIQLAERMGPGYTVFRVNGRDHFGICKSAAIPKERTNIGKFIIRKDAQQRYYIVHQTK